MTGWWPEAQPGLWSETVPEEEDQPRVALREAAACAALLQGCLESHPGLSRQLWWSWPWWPGCVEGRRTNREHRKLTTAPVGLVLTRTQLLRRLSVLLPHSGRHQWSYHGVFAPASKVRPLVVLRPEQPKVAVAPAVAAEGQGAQAPRARSRVPWAELLRRTFGHEVLVCPKCQGRRQVIAVLHQPAVVQKVLSHLGLPTERPEPQRARPKLQLVLPLVGEGEQLAPDYDLADPPWRDDQVSEAHARYGLAA